jgi:hypothetical protein
MSQPYRPMKPAFFVHFTDSGEMIRFFYQVLVFQGSIRS